MAKLSFWDKMKSILQTNKFYLKQDCVQISFSLPWCIELENAAASRSLSPSTLNAENAASSNQPAPSPLFLWPGPLFGMLFFSRDKAASCRRHTLSQIILPQIPLPNRNERTKEKKTQVLSIFFFILFIFRIKEWCLKDSRHLINIIIWINKQYKVRDEVGFLCTGSFGIHSNFILLCPHKIERLES